MIAHQELEELQAVVPYEGNYQHLQDELRRLDLLIRLRTAALKLAPPAPGEVNADAAVRISHDDVEWLLGLAPPRDDGTLEEAGLRHQLEQCQHDIDARVKASMGRGVFLALPYLAHLLGLSPLELQAVILCLAPDLDRKYSLLYAYLQGDNTRTTPSVDLVLDLMCGGQEARWHGMTHFPAEGSLFRLGILHQVASPPGTVGASDLTQPLMLDPRVRNYILGKYGVDERLAGLVTLHPPSPSLGKVLVEEEIKGRLLNLVRHQLTQISARDQRLVLNLHGPHGVGHQDLALGLCGDLNCPVLSLDLEALLAREGEFDDLLRLVFREVVLLQAALYCDHVDLMFKDDDRARSAMVRLAEQIKQHARLTFLAGEKPWLPKELFQPAVFAEVKLPMPGVPLREAAWQLALERLVAEADPAWAPQLASQFCLTPGQIRNATEFLESQRAMNGRHEIGLSDLYAACRRQSTHKLGELALSIEPRYNWSDIVLPAEKVLQLKEICYQIQQRHRVLSQWGFDRKLARSQGLCALFSGPPGTGKTMAAEVIAHELQLDLYKVDLSRVVSKYIGETEKNMSRIFDEAETSNAILFFDEADALFGKRTSVSDAHDRYANIETSFLLQKIEEFQGVVILATNLRSNMDEAFTRRIRLIVEFPSPDESSRLHIWKLHFPPEAPLDPEVDFAFLVKQFRIEGGNIKNIALNAAFFAASDGGVINMGHILRGAKREFEKIGKLWDESAIPRPR